MPIYEATFRLLFSRDIEAPSKEIAEKIAYAIGQQVYQSDKDFKFVQLSEVKLK